MQQRARIELKFQFQILISMFYYFHTHNRMYASQQILCETQKLPCVCGDRNGPFTYQAELFMHINNVLNISVAQMLYGTYLYQKCCLSETQKWLSILYFTTKDSVNGQGMLETSL